MPVSEVSAELDTVGPYNRLSASQVNAYNSCQRLWFYEKVLKLKIKQIPVLYVGRAVEEAICRTLKESPKLLLASASENTLSKIPMSSDGKPSRDPEDVWPASRIIPLSESQLPNSISELKDWAEARLVLHLENSLTAAKIDWERQERKSGDWSEVDFDYCFEMCQNAMKFHLTEVEKCYTTIDDLTLQKWRQGHRDYWPAPDGFGYQFTDNHPLADAGDITLTEAWEIARPWFVEPESGQFSMNAIHPEYWFQGEYDLVYRWNGKVKIVDIKASKGIGDRSGDYVQQLKMYAMLWWITHDKSEVVSDLEIWYLGADVIKAISCPTTKEMTSMEEDLKQLWSEIKGQETSIEQFVAIPSPLRGFTEGGVPNTLSDEQKRCDKCEWSGICEGGNGFAYQEPRVDYQLPGLLTPIKATPFDQLNVRFNLSAKIETVNYPESRPPDIKIIQDGFRAVVDFRVEKNQDGEPNYPSDLSKNDEIYLHEAIITANYKGELTVKMDPLSRISKAPMNKEYNDTLLNFRARWDIVGKLAYKFERSGIGKNGREWRRKGLVLYNNNQSIKVSGWANDWGHQFDMAEEGDFILLSNLELDAWANQLRGQIGRNSRLDVIGKSAS
ncbi:MAG: PD-(D/E)XK nuclease family protein [Candidatus Thermoplasmatota archaeon]|nr:PD-(D/E)XK nuclease family protein [Candidatus Thermoplasmatota archaeon]